MTDTTHKFPAQQLPYKQKGKTWRKQCVDFACNHPFLVNGANRKSVIKKQINYNLLNGILDMEDLEIILNPTNTKDNLIPKQIQHYPIINSKLQVLRGEESKRLFDYRAIVTDPNSISEASNEKKTQLLQDLQQLIENTSISEEQLNQRLEELNQYYTYTWQDLRERRANILFNHYNRENNFSILFNDGIMDALTVGEEIYICDIIGGEPTIEKLDPKKVTVVRNSYSKNIEDADMIIIEDYWSPGKIYDVFGEQLTDKDRKYIENLNNPAFNSEDVPHILDISDSPVPLEERMGLIGIEDETKNKLLIKKLFTHNPNVGTTQDSVVDFDGNIKVVRVFWKSRRKIKKVTSFDSVTAEELVDFYPETYIPDKDKGEKEEAFWINEAWEGTRIGEEVYVNIRPRPIQYNRLSNPSLCHFGIIGSIYAVNDAEPYSMVDMMKPYNYLYDVIHDRLNKLIAKNYGKLVRLDMSLVPDGWKVDKWLYFARKDKIAVTNSFNEGKIGAATGKLAGGLNNASNGVIDLDEGNTIQQYMNLLEFAKMEMSEVVGISKQREGQIANRETVGGVERATLQSSHITEWLFALHDDTRRRVQDVFLETCKVAYKGRNVKFQYILPDMTIKMMDIDGEDFADCDYGVVSDNSTDSQKLASQLETLAQAALQNQLLDFSTIMKLYGSSSLAEKQRMVEKSEQNMKQQQQQMQQQQMQMEQQKLQSQQQEMMAKLEQENLLNERDNETKIVVATISAQARQLDNSNIDDGIQEPMSEAEREKLNESIRQFNAKLELDKERLAFDKQKANTDARLKEKQINSRPKTTKK